MTKFLVTPQEMTLGMAETIVGEPAIQWQGRCHEIACILSDHL